MLSVKEHIRMALQYLNAIGGSIILDGLNKDEIADLVINKIKTLLMGNKDDLDFDEAESYEENIDDE